VWETLNALTDAGIDAGAVIGPVTAGVLTP
jgi:hypothetical protein